MFAVPRGCDARQVPSRKPEPCSARTAFGRNVSRLRERAKLTQERFAELVGISVRYAQSLEAGEYFPALPTLLKIKRVLRASWDELFDGC